MSTRVVAPAELDAELARLIATIVEKPFAVCAAGKALFYRQLEAPLEDGYAAACGSISANMLGPDAADSWYGESHILHGAAFDVYAGEVVALLGRKGAGETTTLKSVMGMVGQRRGSVVFEGVETIAFASNRIARLGIAICPEERGIFSSVDVEENLLLSPRVKAGGPTVAQIFELFPNLKERLHSQGPKLSGGEQQMLAMGG